MPRKTDSIPINNELLDRRVKLTKDQKELIVWLREEEQISYQKLANQFNVSKRSIIFICRPELKAKDLENRKKRGGSKIYYNREKHTIQIREHRDYKKELNEKGLLKIKENEVDTL
jgi:DeoR/GlpR family transcriptional regulator of sugar metabolism